ncbi:uncharacterized protein LOC134656050 [Cydia amplana]|uniref:uncharacterized protein LOC134656050 n=1 Tax=Cydia amplana TaxID=1869771 RepID=UPI002FE667DD
MSEPRKNHLTIDGGQPKDDEHVATYKPIPEADTEFRSSKSSLHKSKEKVDEAEEKLLEKEDEAKIVTRVDMADAKYVVGDHRNGDAKIELDANKRQFSGLTKEELMKYADDPFWIRLRWAMFILFWALWLCMLAGAIVIIVRTPKCAPPPPREWFEKYALIESDGVLPTDSDLDLLHDSEVGGVFAQFNCGADAYELLKTNTCLDQFKDFVAKAKSRSVKVIVDLIANYVPTTHEWFVKSQAREPAYDSYFIWHEPKGYNGTHPNPPNNWRAVTNEGAWAYSEARKELYLSQYGAGKADLNFRNPDVVKQFDDVLKAYMKEGAAGVRLSHARLLLVSASFQDDQLLANTDKTPTGPTPTYGDYNFLRHTHTADQPELDALLAHFSQVVDDNAAEPGAMSIVGPRMLPCGTHDQLLANTDKTPTGPTPTYGDYNFLRHTHTADQPELDALLAHFSQIVDDNAAEPGAKKSVFTIKETNENHFQELYLLAHNVSFLRPPSAAAISVDVDPAVLVNKTSVSTDKFRKWPALQGTNGNHFQELYLLAHNVSSLRPPSAAAISVDVDPAVLVNKTSVSTDKFRKWPALQGTNGNHFQELYLLAHNVSSLRPPSAAAISVDVDPAVLVNKTSVSTDKFRKWPALQLTTAETTAGAEVAAFAHLLPAAPALTVPQLALFNSGDAKSELGRLTALRSEASIQHGDTKMAAVPARNSTLQLVAIARWKLGHTGYIAVLNTQPEMLSANLTAIGMSELPAQLNVHYVSHQVANLTGYATKKPVDCDNVVVPAMSSVVLEFVPKIPE